jgi:hypothetical protein
MWIEQHIPADQIDFTIDLYDKATNKFMAIVKKTDGTFLLIIYDGNSVREINT